MKKKPVKKEPVPVKKQTVQELFQTKKPKPKPVQKVYKPVKKPVYQAPIYESGEDMF